MLLKNAISINLAVTAILSIFMLQMGSDSETSIWLPFLSIPIIAVGIYLVDFKKKFALSEGWMNLLVLAAVGIHIGNLIQSPSAFLAYSIANILAWILVILFFRKKDVLTLYHILTLSFVNGGVASVFQQSSIFAPLLLGFAFSVLISVSLLFMNQERVYYRSHAFLKSAFARGEKVKRVTVGHLAVLAVKTVVVVPLMVLLGYRWKEWLEKQSSEKTVTVHSPEETSAVNGGGLFNYWETAEGKAARPILSGGTMADSETAVSWTVSDTAEAAYPRELRWPLLRQAPMFSGAGRREESSFIGRKYLFRLFTGACFSLIAGFLIFIFFPRFDSDQMEIGSVRFGHDQWKGTPRPVRSVTGFNEQVRLGEMGPLGNNFESVMRIRLTDCEKNDEPVLSEGNFFYLRGSILSRYEEQQWSASDDMEDDPPRKFRRRDRNNPEWLKEIARQEKMPGYFFPAMERAAKRERYRAQNRLVKEEIELEPMTTPILFAVWPFFQVKQTFGNVQNGRYLRSEQDASRLFSMTVYTNAFSADAQAEITPVQEGKKIISTEWSAFDSSRFPNLAEAAKNWDRESNRDQNDITGRAKYLESRLRDSGEYAYTRNGVERDYGMDPLDDFIAVHKTGHCEYFAGALTLMLRAVGIPARMVVGFAAAYKPNVSGYTIIRQSDAHTWVEAYIPPDALPSGTFNPESKLERAWWSNGGWLRLDAVPQQKTAIIRSFSIRWRSCREQFQKFWAEYVMNYNSNRQKDAVYRPAASLFQTIGWQLQTLAGRINPFRSRHNQDASFTVLDGTAADGSGQTSRNWLTALWGIGLAAGTVWGFFLYKKRRQRKDLVQFRSERMISAFWERLEKLIARLGLIRSRNETPREFLDRFLVSAAGAAFCRNTDSAVSADLPESERAGAEPVENQLRRILALYYQVRFGAGIIADEDKNRMERFFHQAETILKKNRSAADQKVKEKQ